MKAVQFINPEGEVVDVPASEADHFDAKGWDRADGSAAKTYADMSVKELKALLSERNIEAEGKKEDLIAALEAADETK